MLSAHRFLSALFLLCLCVNGVELKAEEAPVRSEIPGLDTRALGNEALLRGLYDEAISYYRAYYQEVKFFETLRIEAKLLLIRTLTLKGQYLLALEEIETLRQQEKVDEAILMMSELRIRICITDRPRIFDLLNQLSRRSAELKPDDYTAYLGIWMLYYQMQNNWEMALLDAQKLEKYATENKLEKQARKARFQRIYYLTKLGSTTLAEAQISKLKPENEEELCEADILRSLIFLSNNNISGALEKYQQASKRSSFKGNVLAPILSRDLANEMISLKRYKEAAFFLNELYENGHNPTLQSDALRRMIDLQILTENKALAIETMSRYLQFYPEAVDALKMKMRLIQLLIERGAVKEILAHFKTLYRNKQLRQDERLDMLRYYARFLKTQSDEVLTETIYNEIVQTAKTPSIRAEAYFELGELKFKQQKYQEAIDFFQIAKKTSEDWETQCVYMLMMSYIQLGNDQQAMLFNSELLTRIYTGTMYEDALYFNAYLSEKQEQFLDAIAIYQKFISMYPKHKRTPVAMLSLGEILLGKNDLDSARSHFENLIKNYPHAGQIANARYQLIYTYCLMGADSESLRVANDLIEQNAQTAYAIEGLNFLIDYNLSKGHYEQALHMLENMLQLQSLSLRNRAQAMFDLAKIHMQMKQYTKALETLSFAQQLDLPLDLKQKIAILSADILSAQKKFALAALGYLNAAKLAPETVEGLVATGRMGDALFSQYSADADVNDYYLREARGCYYRLLNDPHISPEMMEQTLWKVGHIHHLLREREAALKCFMRPILLRNIDPKRVSATNVWLIKCAQGAISILRKDMTHDNGSKVVNICDLMLELDPKNMLYYQRIKGEIQSEFQVPLQAVKLLESFPVKESLLPKQTDFISLDSVHLNLPEENKNETLKTDK